LQEQNWTVEDWKNVAWSDESRLRLMSMRHSDGRVRIWRKQNENMDYHCAGKWWWFNGVGDVFLAHFSANW